MEKKNSCAILALFLAFPFVFQRTVRISSSKLAIASNPFAFTVVHYSLFIIFQFDPIKIPPCSLDYLMRLKSPSVNNQNLPSKVFRVTSCVFKKQLVLDLFLGFESCTENMSG